MIARKTNARMSILKKSAKRRKSPARRKRNVASHNASKITVVMMITAHAAGVKSSMSRTYLISKIKEVQYLSSIR